MVRLQLTVHTFFCLNQECQQKIFTERQLPIPSSTSLARAVVLLSSRRIDQDERSDSSFITALQTPHPFMVNFPTVSIPLCERTHKSRCVIEECGGKGKRETVVYLKQVTRGLLL